MAVAEALLQGIRVRDARRGARGRPQGLWDFEKPDVLVIGSQVVGPDTFRGKVEGGLLFTMPQGFSLRATGSYDGIGSSDFHAYGGQLWVNLPLQ
jgi:hypothetical protein